MRLKPRPAYKLRGRKSLIIVLLVAIWTYVHHCHLGAVRKVPVMCAVFEGTSTSNGCVSPKHLQYQVKTPKFAQRLIFY